MKRYYILAAALPVFAVTSCGLFKKQAPAAAPAASAGNVPALTVASGPEEIQTMVQQKARYKGNINDFFAKNIRYPEKVGENNIQGRVIVQFDITADGTVENVIVLRGLNEACNKEAARLIQLTSGSWQPELLAGKPVRSTYTCPVDFKLN